MVSDVSAAVKGEGISMLMAAACFLEHGSTVKDAGTGSEIGQCSQELVLLRLTFLAQRKGVNVRYLYRFLITSENASRFISFSALRDISR